MSNTFITVTVLLRMSAIDVVISQRRGGGGGGGGGG